MANDDQRKKNSRPSRTSAKRIREKKRKLFADSAETPAFRTRKHPFRKRSFRRHYDLFRQGGLGTFNSFFNAFYITITEKSLEREEKRRENSGEETSAEILLEYESLLLKAISFFPRKLGAAAAFFLSFWKRDSSGKRRSKMAFLRAHKLHCIILALALFVGIFSFVQLSVPVVLRAQIDGKVIGIVENKHVVDSAVGALEDNVEIILGKSFHFPHEIRYTFARTWRTDLTERSELTEVLYTYVSEYICTAGGLYVDDVLVAVCEDAESVQRGLDDFVAANATNGETGIYNEIRILTQAYPTESILDYEEYQLLLKELYTPLDQRKKEPVPGETVLTEAGLAAKEEAALPAVVLVSDSAFVPEESTASRSNYPQPIGDLKLWLYTAEDCEYETAIPFETVYAESAEHYTSMADATTRGRDGLSRVRARVYYVEGKEVKREVLSEQVLAAPVTRVISIGTKILPEALGYKSGRGSFIVPRVGYVSHYYGDREDGFHVGWDIPGDEGDNLYAAASGRVVVAIGPDGFFAEKSANHYTGYGYCVVIEHADGYSTMYAHCNDIFVTLGQEVRQGDKIAEVGNTGKSEGDHVHFEIMHGSTKCDPAQYLYQGTKTIYDK